jgi:Kef-type K+ transport system membrane component KefB
LLEIFGSVLLGAVVGLILGFVLRRMRSKTHIITLTIAAIFLCAGLSNAFHFSLILANLSLGMVMVNTFLLQARNAGDTIQRITPPVFVIFFVLAGAHLDIRLLPVMGVLGIVYIVTRSLGKVFGASLSASLTKAEPVIRKYLGLAILSQAGVAIGLALLVVHQFGDLGPRGAQLAMLSIGTITATTIILEIIGPLGVKIAITRAGEAETD